MAKFQFCVACLEDLDRAVKACAVELPVPELAVAIQRVNDGTREYDEYLCEEHIGATLELAINSWGFTLKDRAIARPHKIN
jgi:hypothetical protein